MYLENLEPKTRGQKTLLKTLQSDYELIGVFGPSGTGKSMISLLYGLDSVIEKRYDRLIVSRPIIDVETGKEIPITAPLEYWEQSIRQYMRDLLTRFVDEKIIDDMERQGRITYVHPHLLRGRSFDRSVIIFDDAQNTGPDTVVEIILRLGEESKLVIIGDPILQASEKNGAIMARSLLIGELEDAAVVDLGLKDIVRPGAIRGIKLLFESRMRSRSLTSIEKSIYESANRNAPDADIITVVSLKELKEKWGVTSSHTPDALIIVKEGHLPRLIGVKGERIGKVEQEFNQTIRGVELDLDFSKLVRAIHPVGWVFKHVRKSDMIGSDLVFWVSKEGIGAFIGQKGSYAKFLESVLEELLGVGLVVKESASRRKP